MEPNANPPTFVEIRDNRPQTEFKINTLSNFKRTDVRKALLDAMSTDKMEPACYWTAELLCSGHLDDIWELFFHFMSKHIHVGNPRLPIYMLRRFQNFRHWFREQDEMYSELEARNDPMVRTIIIEIVSILVTSLKKNQMEHQKINRQEEFDMTKMMDRFKAPTLEYAEQVMKPGDPKEMSIAVNELLYHILSKNYKHAIYWVDWIIEFDVICRSRKELYECESRHYEWVTDEKCQGDLVWLIWDSIFVASNQKNSFLQQSIQALHTLFCVRYTNSCCRKRRYMMYHAIAMLTEPMDATIPCNRDPEWTKLVQMKMETIIFGEIKKNEITNAFVAKTEKQRNREKSLQKLNLLSSVLEN
jgi:hypothetical protein